MSVNETIDGAMRRFRFARLCALAAGQHDIADAIFGGMEQLDAKAAWASLLPMVLEAIEHGLQSPSVAWTDDAVIDRLAVTAEDVRDRNVKWFTQTVDKFLGRRGPHLTAAQYTKLADALDRAPPRTSDIQTRADPVIWGLAALRESTRAWATRKKREEALSCAAANEVELGQGNG